MLRASVLIALSSVALGSIPQARSFSGDPSGGEPETRAHEAQAPPVDLPEDLSASDWASIRDAYEAGRHTVFAVEGGHRVRNPGQRWATLFDGRGFTTTPDVGGWSWGLELEGYGWGEVDHAAATPAGVTTDGQRLSYEWDGRLTEWYVNDVRGLEHGYTVHSRPEIAAGPLRLTLAIRGALEPRVSADGRDVRFADEQGSAVLDYAGLKAFDAQGRALRASWRATADGLELRVDERDAAYPLTIDPIAQQAYLKASNAGAGDRFGFSVAVSGDTVVVGAPLEASSTMGVNGNQSDNTALDSGAAYVFVRNGTSWSQQAYLKASNTGAADNFGDSVAVSGDTVVVGARGEGSNATGVNGNQSDNSAFNPGAAYVFVRSGTSWSQQAYLKASNTDGADSFGDSVAVSGDTVVVGAPGEDSSATGVNGNQSDFFASWSGAAYVFVRSGTSWGQQAYLKASNTGAFDSFGRSVAVSGDTVVVGAWGESSSSTGVNGNQSDNSATSSGAAYVFVRSGTSWSQQAYLKASNTDMGDRFGFSVAISGDTVVVGTQGEDSSAMGVNGNQNDNNAGDSGAAHVFVRSGTSWSQQAYLKASNTGAFDNFGWSVAVAGDTVVVGALWEDSSATGVNGNQSDDSASDSGAAYVFVRSGTSWSQQAYLKASNRDFEDEFGNSVAVSGNTVVVGAHREDSSATGVNGNQSDNSAAESGAAYAFFSPALSADVGAISLSIGGTQTLSLDAGPAHAGRAYLLVGSLSGTSPGLLLGPGLALPLNYPDPYFDLTLTSPAPILTGSLGLLDAAGAATVLFTLPAGLDVATPALVGLTVNHAYVLFLPSLDFVSNAVPALLGS